VPSQVVLEGDATVDASFTLALGATFSCAVDRGTGGVQCWGDGATRPPDAPGLFTAGGQQAPLITAARYFACAVGQGATQVSCAGVPFEGGDTLSWDKLGPNLPVGASGGFQQLSNGDRFGCLLTTGGQAACWGMNDHGQLGDGTTATPMFPTTGGLVANGASVTVLSTGPGSHRCLGFTSGIACWGVNDEGQVDPMLPPTDQPTPVNLLTLPGGAQARSMGTGGHHTCAVYDAGAPLMTCWGRSAEGQLTNTPPDANGLVDVPAIGMGWKNVVTGDLHTCALDMNGQLACWGDSEWGQLGIGASDVAVATPIASLASP
jgi:hypothetical protein